MLLKYVKAKPPVTVNEDKCVGCKMCMKIGCPAISKGSDGLSIDSSLCNGCGLCTKVCKFDSIKVVAKEGK